MPASQERLRPRPSERFAGPARTIDLSTAARRLRAEPSAPAHGLRSIALLHHGPVRLILFAFDANEILPQHQAAGWVTIQVLRGSVRVGTPDGQHLLREGQLLMLAPDVLHDVAAMEEAEMLLGIHPEAPLGSEMAPPPA